MDRNRNNIFQRNIRNQDLKQMKFRNIEDIINLDSNRVMNINIKSDKVLDKKPKKFRKDGKYFHFVRIYLDSHNSQDLDIIEFVEYELHPTFRNRYRVSEDRSKNFETKLWTYGYFDISAKLILIDGTEETITGKVRW